MRKSLLTCMFILIVVMFSVTPLISQMAVYDTVSVHDLQYLENPVFDAAHPELQESVWFGDTVTVKAYVRHSPREFWIGARWACYVTEDLDEPQDPWSGFFVIQSDSTEINTLFSFIQEGDEVYFTGKLSTYTGLTQLEVYEGGAVYAPDPVIPITIVSSGNTLPIPKVVTLADLATHVAGEQWESQYVRVENCIITNNDYSSGMAVITDGTATGYIDDYFMYFRKFYDNRIIHWPANGTSINIQGYTRDIGYDYFSINPRDTTDIEVLSNPPLISEISRDIGFPKSTDAVNVTATIIDNVTVAGAILHYSVDWGTFVELAMIASRTVYGAQIPAQPNNSYVRYFISAVDNVGDFSQMPGDTSGRVYYYVVKDDGPSIKDIQYTWGYTYEGSGFRDFVTTLEGVVMTDTMDWTNNYYIQEKDSMWSGIWVYDNVNRPNKGDWIRIAGTVEENYGVTRFSSITDYQVITPDYGVFDPVTVSTEEVSTSGENGEAYESVLIQVLNVTVTNPFPDGSGNFGEFLIDDGTGGVRVDDAFSSFDGNLDTTYKLNHTIEKLIGMGYYSYSDYKILPRGYDDIIGHVTGLKTGDPVIQKYRLDQNYPNPFNNATAIRFAVATAEPVTLIIYNILGQPARTLFNSAVTPGTYDIFWNGKDNSGNTVSTGIYFYQLQGKEFSQTRKMLFIK
ncbi:MAG: T9SS type A sorting domain-containing protein [bacterium]